MEEMIGLKRGAVILKKHHQEWRAAFETEKIILKNLLGDTLIDIQHIGSTAVDGLAAKPIIDMLIGIKSLPEIATIGPILEKAGYEYRENGSDNRQILFVKGPEELRTHYLHFTEYGNDRWKNDLAFRDYLITHPERLKEYERIKKELASKYADNRTLYTKNKNDFIQRTISLANMSLYEKTIEFVDRSFGKKKAHFERTVYWIEKFIPDATEAQKIAAYAHDIERGINGENDRDYLNRDFIAKHQDQGAQIMKTFLEKNGADNETITIVAHLISRHEFGGDDEQNALMDADSVSFFETNAKHFVEDRITVDGYEKIKGKFDWMFDRISSEEHKNLARENYNKYSDQLNSLA